MYAACLRLPRHAGDVLDHRIAHEQSSLPERSGHGTNRLEGTVLFGHHEKLKRTEDRNVQPLSAATRGPVVYDGRPPVAAQGNGQHAALASPEVPGGYGFGHRPRRLHEVLSIRVKPCTGRIVRRRLTDFLGHPVRKSEGCLRGWSEGRDAPSSRGQ